MDLKSIWNTVQTMFKHKASLYAIGLIFVIFFAVLYFFKRRAFRAIFSSGKKFYRRARRYGSRFRRRYRFRRRR